MASVQTFLIFAGLLLLALLLQPLAERLRMPFAVVLVATGFIASELLVAAGFDTGIRAGSFHDLIFYVFLPVLVFESAFNIDARLLWRNLLPILFLAIPLLLLSTLITAALVYYGIGHPGGFPWIAALLTGALLSATDPVAVVALLRQAGVAERLSVLLEGESLFNDATAIVLFGLFLALAESAGSELQIASAAREFLRVFLGGLLFGAASGALFLLAGRLARTVIPRALLSLLCAWLTFLVAESLLHVSGVMAVLLAGLLAGSSAREQGDREDGFVNRLWEFNAYLANILVFLLMGITITIGMFEERWLAMLIGIAGVLVARGLGIFTCVPLLNRVTPIESISRPYQAIMVWGGLRGAVTLALALSLPVTLDYWWTIQSIAFGVVLFTLLVQSTTVPALLHRLRP